MQFRNDDIINVLFTGKKIFEKMKHFFQESIKQEKRGANMRSVW